MAVAVLELVEAFDLVGGGVVGVGDFVGGSSDVDDERGGVFYGFGGAVVVDVVELEAFRLRLDGKPCRELHALGGGGGFAIVAVLEDAGPVAGQRGVDGGLLRGLRDGSGLRGGDRGEEEAGGEDEFGHGNDTGWGVGWFLAKGIKA